ncbi:hypothetical protein SEPCBS57363_005340 [Sporothrix epigloea]|uniref:Ring-like domain-containing protein n=1 Tax=Sporothrix epigloea TaxID=1892477 RepID=A0ABP0DY63_9PEZI
MLDYFNVKKNRKPVGSGLSSTRRSHEQRDEEQPPKQPPRPITSVEDVAVLDRDEQSFLENLTLEWNASDDGMGDELYDHKGNDNGDRPPLPPRIKTPDLTWDSDSESFVKGDQLVAVDNDILKQSDEKKSQGGVAGRLSTLFSSRKTKDAKVKDKDKENRPHTAHLVVPGQIDVDAAAASSSSQLVVSKSEEERERDDLARVLDDLDFANDTETTQGQQQSKASKFAVSLSAESTALVHRFVTVLKDLVHGVPTAADDLKNLLDDRDGTLARGFERLPSSLRKLVSQLPSKLTSSLAPELLAAAAASQGIQHEEARAGEAGGVSIKTGAKTLLPFLTKPNAIVKMLKAIMNALKLRWPAFIGTSAIWSVALFLLLFVLWYCHKRGREVRLEKEAGSVAKSDDVDAAGAVDAGEPPVVIKSWSPEDEASTPVASAATTTAMPRPPIGADAPK